MSKLSLVETMKGNGGSEAVEGRMTLSQRVLTPRQPVVLDPKKVDTGV
jgi:hypothetical protein